jgi:MOSC domain-containing protein YiiM
MTNIPADTSLFGRIFQINTSSGGVPKSPQQAVRVNELGILGDKQTHTKVHGGLERALCLYSLEHILDLQSEGHPVYPGALGENITFVGVDWSEIVPNARLKLGDELVIEITRFTTPCKTIEHFFREAQIDRISQVSHPGWSRAYARVLSTGSIRIGDLVRKMV